MHIDVSVSQKKICGTSNCSANHHHLLHKDMIPLTHNAIQTVAQGCNGNVNTHNDDSQRRQCFRILPIMVLAQRLLHFLMKVRLLPLWKSVSLKNLVSPAKESPWNYNELAIQLDQSKIQSKLT